jgi:O-antigen/teichoic acid export membrane protein
MTDGTTLPVGVHSASVPSKSRFRDIFGMTLLANGVAAATQFASLVILSRRAGNTVAGEWTLALAITTPAFVLAYSRVRSVVTTDITEQHAWSDYLGLRIVAVGIATAASVLVAGLAFDLKVAATVAAMSFGRCGDAVSDVVYGFDYRAGTERRAAKSLIVRSVVAFAAFIAVFLVGHSLIAALRINGLVQMIGSIVDLRSGIASTVAEWRPRFDVVRLARLAREVIPLGVAGTFSAIQISAPRYALAAHRSKDELGLFGQLSALLLLGSLVVSAAGQAITAQLARSVVERQWEQLRATISRLLLFGFSMSVFVTAVCVTAGSAILKIVFGAAASKQSGALVVLAVSFGLVWCYVYLGTALDALRRYRAQPWIHGMSALVTLGLSWLLVRRHGIGGAAWALFGGYVVECIAYVVVVRVVLGEARRVSV